MYKRFRIFLISLLITAAVIAGKIVLHALGYEIFTLGSLHTAVVTGTFFVIGFLLSSSIADYKESERVPAELASILEDMYEDARATHQSYPGFDLEKFRNQLRDIAQRFDADIRKKKHTTRLAVHKLNESFVEMEKAGVPPNFIVKLKQQESQLSRLLFRVTYIQRITFIPSSRILAYSIVPLTVGLLAFTEVEPLLGGTLITAIICFILIYILLLIQVISTPFQGEGKTQDDVSLFLVDETVDHLKRRKR